ncbi:MAG TPA: DUF4342 domain-containing protein [Planctomycetota bacterium]|jgi:Domain of unknown function (DUF4342)|nr:DUF4342 domain-containing protein [Planctomycetota bacterium]
MTGKTAWESFRVEGGELLERVKEIIEAGNARSIVIKQDGRRIAEFPLTVGVVGAVLAPVLAAVGALAAVLSKCTIEVERIVPEGKSNGAKKTSRTRRSR